MAKTIENTKKRTYKHSDAWIKAHEGNVVKRVSTKKDAVKKSKKTKTLDKKPATKLTKKFDVKKINSLFEDAKKKNASLKKTMKEMSDKISMILADNDQKTYEKLLKKLAFYGFNIIDGILSNTITSVKVKMPKVKTPKVKNAMKAEKIVEDDSDDVIDDVESAKIPDVVDTTIDDNEATEIPDISTEPTDEELSDIENEDDEDEDEMIDDPDLDEDERAQLREDRRLEREYERDCRGMSDDAINEAMCDNGDWN